MPFIALVVVVLISAIAGRAWGAPVRCMTGLYCAEGMVCLQRGLCGRSHPEKKCGDDFKRVPGGCVPNNANHCGGIYYCARGLKCGKGNSCVGKYTGPRCADGGRAPPGWVCNPKMPGNTYDPTTTYICPESPGACWHGEECGEGYTTCYLLLGATTPQQPSDAFVVTNDNATSGGPAKDSSCSDISGAARPNAPCEKIGPPTPPTNAPVKPSNEPSQNSDLKTESSVNLAGEIIDARGKQRSGQTAEQKPEQTSIPIGAKPATPELPDPHQAMNLRYGEIYLAAGRDAENNDRSCGGWKMAAHNYKTSATFFRSAGDDQRAGRLEERAALIESKVDSVDENGGCRLMRPLKRNARSMPGGFKSPPSKQTQDSCAEAMAYFQTLKENKEDVGAMRLLLASQGCKVGNARPTKGECLRADLRWRIAKMPKEEIKKRLATAGCGNPK